MSIAEIYALQFPVEIWKGNMRVRNRKGATELLEANPQYVVLNPEDAKESGMKFSGMTILFISKWVAEKGLYYWDGQGQSRDQLHRN